VLEVLLLRRGQLQAAGAALESSLTVEGADRVLQALTPEDHLEHGRLMHALWERNAPP
jgi:hypothetical protein